MVSVLLSALIDVRMSRSETVISGPAKFSDVQLIIQL
jgi:hypothetical protein